MGFSGIVHIGLSNDFFQAPKILIDVVVFFQNGRHLVESYMIIPRPLLPQVGFIVDLPYTTNT